MILDFTCDWKHCCYAEDSFAIVNNNILLCVEESSCSRYICNNFNPTLPYELNFFCHTFSLINSNIGYWSLLARSRKTFKAFKHNIAASGGV